MSRKIEDFPTLYAPKIFAIDPATSFKGNGCGWALLNRHPEYFGGTARKPVIHRTGVIQPFYSESSLGNMMQLANKLKEICKDDTGFCREPEIIVIERPVIYPNSPVSHMSLMDLAFFTGLLSNVLKFSEILVPTPQEWKGNKSKEQTQTDVLAFCDSFSKRNIQRDLQNVATHKRNNAFDAMGLGIYTLKVLNGQASPPRLHYKVDMDRVAGISF